MSIVYRDTMQLALAPARALSFVMTPERILDYYPSPIDCGELVPGESFWCRGRSAVTLLERVPEECTAERITLRVTASSPRTRPTGVEALRAAPMMTMVEDWAVRVHDGGTSLQKTWRDLRTFGLVRLLPMGLIVRRAARAERQKLIDGWNAAAARAAD